MSRTLFLVVLFFLFYAFFGSMLFLEYGIVNNGQDFWFHYNKIIGQNPAPYPPLFHYLFGLFQDQLLFYFACIFLVVVVVPFLLFWLSKSWWSVFAYFCVFSFPHMVLYSATYPMALLLVWFLLYWLKRDWKAWLPLAVLAFFTHKQGAMLFLAIAAMEIVLLLQNKAKYKLGFAPAMGYLQPVFLSKATLREAFLVHLPFATIIPAIKKINGFEALVAGLGIAYSLIDIRTLGLTQLVFCVSLARTLKSTKKDFKIFFIVFGLIQLAFLLLNFVFGTWKYIAFN